MFTSVLSVKLALPLSYNFVVVTIPVLLTVSILSSVIVPPSSKYIELSLLLINSFNIIESLLNSIKRVFYVSLLLFIILYIYATIGSILFGDVIPYRWNDVGVSLITLFQVLTLSSWETVMLPLQEIFWWAWIYFFSFIIICAITMMNLLIAVIVDVMLNQKKL